MNFPTIGYPKIWETTSPLKLYILCYIATLGSNLGISTLLEILQTCKLGHKVA